MTLRIIAAAALLTAASAAQATLITFEGATTTGANRILDADGANAHGPSLIDYAGFDWSGMVVAKPGVAINRPSQITGIFNDPDDGPTRVTTQVDAGFHRSVVSGDTIAFTQSFNGSSSLAASIRSRDDTNFNFNSVYMTAGWRDNIGVLVTGLRDGVSVYSLNLVVQHDGPLLYDLGFLDIDEIRFVTSGGDFLYANSNAVGGFVNPSNAFSTPTLAFDDMDISAAVQVVPEPSSLALLGLGVFALVAAGRRARR